MRSRSGGIRIASAPRRAARSARSPPLPDSVGVGRPAGRRDDARVDVARAHAADRRQHPVLREAQQLGLQLGRHLADLVEKQRPALGLLDDAGLRHRRLRVRAARVAEQLALHQLARQRRAVDRHERPAPAARAVDRVRVDLLARAGLAGEQELLPRLGQLADPLAHAREGGVHRRDRPERAGHLLLDRRQLRDRRHPEHHHVAAHEDDRAVAQLQRRIDRLAVHHRAVGAGEIGDLERPLFGRRPDRQVLAGDHPIGEHQRRLPGLQLRRLAPPDDQRSGKGSDALPKRWNPTAAVTDDQQQRHVRRAVFRLVPGDPGHALVGRDHDSLQTAERKSPCVYGFVTETGNPEINDYKSLISRVSPMVRWLLLGFAAATLQCGASVSKPPPRNHKGTPCSRGLR